MSSTTTSHRNDGIPAFVVTRTSSTTIREDHMPPVPHSVPSVPRTVSSAGRSVSSASRKETQEEEKEEDEQEEQDYLLNEFVSSPPPEELLLYVSTSTSTSSSSLSWHDHPPVQAPVATAWSLDWSRRNIWGPPHLLPPTSPVVFHDSDGSAFFSPLPSPYYPRYRQEEEEEEEEYSIAASAGYRLTQLPIARQAHLLTRGYDGFALEDALLLPAWEPIAQVLLYELERQEHLEGLVILQLAAWKAVCTCYPSIHDAARRAASSEKWYQQGWKRNKKLFARVKDIQVIVDHVAEFLVTQPLPENNNDDKSSGLPDFFDYNSDHDHDDDKDENDDSEHDDSENDDSSPSTSTHTPANYGYDRHPDAIVDSPYDDGTDSEDDDDDDDSFENDYEANKENIELVELGHEYV